jgi:OOP family OmpA-OmpF porin
MAMIAVCILSGGHLFAGFADLCPGLRRDDGVSSLVAPRCGSSSKERSRTMYKKTIAAVAVVVASGVAHAQGADQPGWYAGLDVGQSRSHIDSVNGDDSSTTYGVNGGYRLSRNFAVEGALSRLGSFDQYEANAVSVAGVGILPLWKALSLYGKAGLALTDAKLDPSASHTGTGILVGAGVTYDFAGGYFAKGGWDHYANVGDASTGSGSIDAYNLGVGLRF